MNTTPPPNIRKNIKHNVAAQKNARQLIVIFSLEQHFISSSFIIDRVLLDSISDCSIIGFNVVIYILRCYIYLVFTIFLFVIVVE